MKSWIPANTYVVEPTVAVPLAMPLTGPGPAFTVSGAASAVGTAEKSSSFPSPCPVNTALPGPATKSVDPSDEPLNAVIPANTYVVDPTVAVPLAVPLTGPGPAFTVSGAAGAAATADKSSSFPDPCPVNTALPGPATKSVDPAAEPLNAVIPLNESLPPPLSPVTDPAGTDTTTPAGAPDKSSVADMPGPSKSTPLSVPGWNTTGTARRYP